MNETPVTQKQFEGWAIVDVLGHQRFVGYVTTEYYGSAAFFRVETPAREMRERVTEGNEWPNGWGTIGKGWRVAESAHDGGTRLIGASSVYGITPTTKDDAIKALDDMSPRTVIGVIDADGRPVERPDAVEYPF